MATIAAAAVGLLLATAASASDAQIRATVLHGIRQINHEKTEPLSTDLLVTRATLQSEKPTTATGRTVKTLALAGFHYAQVAATEQARAAEDLTDAHVGSDAYDPSKLDGAQQQIGLAAKNMTAAEKLLRKAARLLHVKIKVK